MNTALHIVINLSVAYRAKRRQTPIAPVVLGAVLPDLAMLVFFPWYKFRGFAEEEIWSTLFFDPNWQFVFAIFNSIPICLFFFVLFWWYRHENLTFFVGSMILHQVVDFFTHSKDAHMHFWPFSEYRFYSPISYWNPENFGFWVTCLELIVFALATRSYWKSFPDWKPKAAWSIMIAFYLVSLLEYWSWTWYLNPPVH